MVEWDTVRIPKSLSEEVEKFLQTDIAKRMGYNSKAQFVIDAVREYLLKMEKRPRLEHINTYSNRVTILDRELEGRGRVIDVIFLEKKNGLEKIVYPYCTYCETTDCLHADYAFEIPEVRRILQQHGIKKRMKGKEIEEV